MPLKTQMPSKDAKFTSLSVIVTIVSGKNALRTNLRALYSQARTENAEIVVPFDRFSSDVPELSTDFPGVLFQFIDIPQDISEMHYVYDLRRAAGISVAKGDVIALTEDHAVPDPDWCRQILAAHELPYDAIGGAIENGVDKTLNWAWYYCDFGRYGMPFPDGRPKFLSDVNLSYKREPLMSVRDVWCDSYQETSVNWALAESGYKLFLDPRPVVRQARPKLPIRGALKERLSWGRVFAETRARRTSTPGRIALAVGTAFLPWLLASRILKQMLRHRRTFAQILSTLPLAFVLSIWWSIGEMLGYVTARSDSKRENTGFSNPVNAIGNSSS
jgi:hypothetical protein